VQTGLPLFGCFEFQGSREAAERERDRERRRQQNKIRERFYKKKKRLKNR
jgi:hypothetical protein